MPNGLNFPPSGDPAYGAHGLHLLDPDDGFLRDDTIDPGLQSDVGAVGFWVKSIGGTGDTFDMSVFASNGGAAGYGGETPRLEFQVAKNLGSEVIRIELDTGQSGGARRIEVEPPYSIFDGQWHFILFQPGSDTPRVVYPSPSTDWYEIWLDGTYILDQVATGNDFYGWFASIQKLANTGFTALGFGCSVRDAQPTGIINLYEGCMDELFVFDYRLTSAQIDRIWIQRYTIEDIANDTTFFSSAPPRNGWTFNAEQPDKGVGFDIMGRQHVRLPGENPSGTGPEDRTTARMDGTLKSEDTPTPVMDIGLGPGRTVVPSTGGYHGDFNANIGPDLMFEREMVDDVAQYKKWPQAINTTRGAISFWHRRINPSNAFVLGVGDNVWTIDRFFIYFSSGGTELRIEWEIANGGVQRVSLPLGFDVDDDIWHHFIINCTGAGNPYDLFVDGVYVTSAGTAGIWFDAVLPGANWLGIGAPRPNQSSWYLDAYLDNVCYHSLALDVTEIGYLYNGGRNYPLHRMRYERDNQFARIQLHNKTRHCYTFDKAIDGRGTDFIGPHDFDIVGTLTTCTGIKTQEIIFQADPLYMDVDPIVSTVTAPASFAADSLIMDLGSRVAFLTVGTEFQADPLVLDTVPSIASLITPTTFTADSLIMDTAGRTTFLSTGAEFSADALDMDLGSRVSFLTVGANFQADSLDIVLEPTSSSAIVPADLLADALVLDIAPRTSFLTTGVNLQADALDVDLGLRTSFLSTGVIFSADSITLDVEPTQSQLALITDLRADPALLDLGARTSFLTVGANFLAEHVEMDLDVGDALIALAEVILQAEYVALDLVPTDAELVLPLPCVCPNAVFPPGLAIPVDEPVAGLVADPLNVDIEPSTATLVTTVSFPASAADLDADPSAASLITGTTSAADSVVMDLEPSSSTLESVGIAFIADPLVMDVVPNEDPELLVTTAVVLEAEHIVMDIAPRTSFLITGTEFNAEFLNLDIEPTPSATSLGVELQAAAVVMDVVPSPSILQTVGIAFAAEHIVLDVDPTAPDRIVTGAVLQADTLALDVDPTQSNVILPGEFVADALSLEIDPTASKLNTGFEVTAESIVLEVDPSQSLLRTATNFLAESLVLEVDPRMSRVVLGTDLGPVDPGILEIVPTPSAFPEPQEARFQADSLILVLDPTAVLLKAGQDPVFEFCVPDRVCTGRVVSRDILVMQEAEEFWVAFNFGPWLDASGNQLLEIREIRTDGPFTISGKHMTDDSGVFRLAIPLPQNEGDFGLEITAIDTEQNVLIVDGMLRIRDGLADA